MIPLARMRVFLAAIALAAVATAAFTIPPPTASAQDDDYVDVGILLEFPNTPSAQASHRINIILVNQGTRAAYDVLVQVKVVSPSNSNFRDLSDAPVGTASLTQNVGETEDVRIEWTIPVLLGGQREEIHARVRHVSPGVYDNTNTTHEAIGKVSTESHESHLHQENNESRAWSYKYDATRHWVRQVAGNYSVSVSVDEPFPAVDDTVNFTITAGRTTNPYDDGTGDVRMPPPIDLKVGIELTGGLTVDSTGAISYEPSGADMPASVSYDSTTNVYTVGTLNLGEARTNSVTLPVTVADDAVVNEQCLTATLTGNPPPGTGPLDDDISDNVAELCLGKVAPLPYFTSTDIEEFVSHPCVGVSSHPCDSTDDVRVRAIYETTDLPLEAGTPLIHVPDNSTTRMYDGDTNSVNAGDIVSWQVPVQISYRPYTNEHERWTDVTDSFLYEMPGKDSNFNKLHIRVSWANALLNDGQRQATFLATYDPGANAPSNGPFDVTAEFEKLGTYKVHYAITATHDNNTPADTTDDVPYPATGSYIFHVGPVQSWRCGMAARAPMWIRTNTR